MATLSDWTKDNIPMSGGAKAPKQHKITSKKVKLGNMERNIHVGPRGGKYVKLMGKLVPLDVAKKGKK